MLKALVLLPMLISMTTQNPRIGVANPRFIERTSSDILLKVPFVHQVDDLPEDLKTLIKTSACGPAAVTMLLNFYHQNISLEEVISSLPTEVYVKGVGFFDLPKADREFGMKSVNIKPTIKSIYQTLWDGHPIILNVQNYDGITGHAVVVTGVKEYNGETAEALIVHDPYTQENVEFKILDEKTLLQPEGYTLYIGIIDPFYMTPSEV